MSRIQSPSQFAGDSFRYPPEVADHDSHVLEAANTNGVLKLYWPFVFGTQPAEYRDETMPIFLDSRLVKKI